MCRSTTADLLTVVSDRIAGAFNRSRTARAVALDIYVRLLRGFGMLVSFTNFSHMAFLVRYLALFCLFLATDGFKWFWMGSIHENIQLMLVFLTTKFLVYPLHFSYHTSMTFLMMLSVILLSMLMLPLSNMSVIRHPNLNLSYDTADWGRLSKRTL